MIIGDPDYKEFDPLITDLLEKIPEYRVVYEHEIDYFGYASAWALLGTKMVRFTLKAFRAYKEDPQNTTALELMKRVFSFIEYYASSTDEAISELIQTSFIEALYQADEDYDEFTALLAPASKIMLAHVERGWGHMQK